MLRYLHTGVILKKTINYKNGYYCFVKKAHVM